MKQLIILVSILFSVNCYAQSADYQPDFKKPKKIKGMKLVWQDEFNADGKPNANFWKHENGFVRNNELQWYQPDNVICKNGLLVFDAQRVNKLNPNFVGFDSAQPTKNTQNWKTSREYITFTSSSIQTRGMKEWLFGTFFIRAKIDTTLGSWPAIWTLGSNGRWPQNGEIDIMEFYRVKSAPTILANFCWGSATKSNGTWDDAKIALSHFTGKNKDWLNQFHIWQMDWNEKAIKIFLDDELINEVNLSETLNPDGKNPFMQPHYLLLNLAIGGNNGGEPCSTTQSIKYEVDYVRVYQKKNQ